MDRSPANSVARATACWAACACAVLSLAYMITQLFEWAGALGSAGGPMSSSTASGIVLLLTPSLLLGSAFLVLIAALHQLAPPPRKLFSQIALAFATIYATLISLVYFVQLTLVAPRIAAGDIAGIEPFLFTPYRSFLFAVDLLGYSFMSLATLAIAFALGSSIPGRFVRGVLIANGLLLPFLAFQMLVPGLIWIAALWGFTFPAAMTALAFALRNASGPTAGR